MCGKHNSPLSTAFREVGGIPYLGTCVLLGGIHHGEIQIQRCVGPQEGSRKTKIHITKVSVETVNKAKTENSHTCSRS